MKFRNADLVVPTINPKVIVENPDIEITRGVALSHHFYYNKDNPSRSPLCLHHPSIGAKWSRDQYLADTIALWTIQHLAAFEIKQDTGDWVLPELHPIVEDETKKPAKSAEPELTSTFTGAGSRIYRDLLTSVSKNKFIQWSE